MQTFYLEKTKDFKKKMKELERELKVKMKLENNTLVITGEPLKEYEASLVLEAIIFGYSVETATLLKRDEINFRIIHIKDFSRKKNMKEIRARLIGTHGMTKRTIEEISGCKIIIKETEVGILGDADEMEYAITAITKLIRGSKQSNVYSYLERINTKNKK